MPESPMLGSTVAAQKLGEKYGVYVLELLRGDEHLWDPREQQFSKNPWSPFEGRRVRGRVVRTIVRGATVYCDGEITASPGHGMFLSSQDEHTLGASRAPTAGMAR